MRSRPHMIATLAALAMLSADQVTAKPYVEQKPREPDPPRKPQRAQVAIDPATRERAPRPTPRAVFYAARKPPMNGAREMARRVRQMERAAARAARRTETSNREEERHD